MTKRTYVTLTYLYVFGMWSILGIWLMTSKHADAIHAAWRYLVKG